MEDFLGQIMRDQMKLRVFGLADEVAALVRQVTAGFLRKEQVFQPLAFNLMT